MDTSMDSDSDIKNNDTNNNINILTLDETELALVSLLENAASTMQCLSSLDPEQVQQSQQYISNYYSTLAQIKQSLLYHISNSPLQREYRLTHYTDFMKNQLQTQKLQLLQNRLKEIKEGNSSNSDNVNTNNSEMKTD